MCATTPARELGLVGHGVLCRDAVADLVVLDAQLCGCADLRRRATWSYATRHSLRRIRLQVLVPDVRHGRRTRSDPRCPPRESVVPFAALAAQCRSARECRCRSGFMHDSVSSQRNAERARRARSPRPFSSCAYGASIDERVARGPSDSAGRTRRGTRASHRGTDCDRAFRCTSRPMPAAAQYTAGLSEQHDVAARQIHVFVGRVVAGRASLRAQCADGIDVASCRRTATRAAARAARSAGSRASALRPRAVRPFPCEADADVDGLHVASLAASSARSTALSRPPESRTAVAWKSGNWYRVIGGHLIIWTAASTDAQLSWLDAQLLKSRSPITQLPITQCIPSPNASTSATATGCSTTTASASIRTATTPSRRSRSAPVARQPQHGLRLQRHQAHRQGLDRSRTRSQDGAAPRRPARRSRCSSSASRCSCSTAIRRSSASRD